MSYSVVIVLLTFATFVKSSEFCTCPTSDDDLSTLKSVHIVSFRENRFEIHFFMILSNMKKIIFFIL
jgi:hypothetical protein